MHHQEGAELQKALDCILSLRGSSWSSKPLVGSQLQAVLLLTLFRNACPRRQ